MDYYKYCFKTAANQTDVIIAFLSLHPFESFEETEDGLNAYIPSASSNNDLDQTINQTLQNIDYQLEKELIVHQNWNKLWESNFEPIVINDFCVIRADFHPAQPNVQHDIIINPKMAFGTGHHETTYMVSEVMEKLDFKGTKVLDYGCGTGILSILAARLGAQEIDAVDIELPSYENTIENADINKVNNIKAIHGTLDNISSKDYDIILANINRNVILNSLLTLYQKIKPVGILVVSGFIKEDENILREAATQHNFIIDIVKQKNNWICMVFHRD